jgi:hypothetical protein
MMRHEQLRAEGESLDGRAKDRGNDYKTTKSMQARARTMYKRADEAEACIRSKVEYAVSAKLFASDEQAAQALGVTKAFVESVRKSCSRLRSC